MLTFLISEEGSIEADPLKSAIKALRFRRRIIIITSIGISVSIGSKYIVY